jgi:transcriptional regulator with PAS, ATPase and Fis domain
MVIFIADVDYDNMKLVQNEMTPILLIIFIILASVIGLNFFIGLMSNVLSDGAYNQVESMKSIEILGFILQHEWRLSTKKRQEHLNRIKDEFSPMILTDQTFGAIDENNKRTDGSENNSEKQTTDADVEEKFVTQAMLEEIKKLSKNIKDMRDEFNEFKMMNNKVK